MSKLKCRLQCLKNACYIFRHYLRWPYPIYRPSEFNDFNHEHTCIAARFPNIELSEVCPIAMGKDSFEVAREDACEHCKYFCRIHYEVNPQSGEKQVHFWMNEDIVAFL